MIKFRLQCEINHNFLMFATGLTLTNNRRGIEEKKINFHWI